MAKIKGAIVVDTERCKGCNLCVVACPLNVISLACCVPYAGPVTTMAKRITYLAPGNHRS